MTGTLAALRRARKHRDDAEQAYRALIRKARDEGHSVRTVADAAGVTHPYVVRLTRK